MSAIHALLAGAIDYAGLFPPATLPMDDAVRNYRTYRTGPDVWALGRLIVPSGRLGELAASAKSLPVDAADPGWRISALLGSDLEADIARVLDFNQRYTAAADWAALVDTIETKVASPADIDRLTPLTRSFQVYAEVPVDPDPAGLVARLAAAGARGKVRTGGIRADLFPTAAELLRFIGACAEAHLAFKATAGLHHPVSAEYRLTYEPDSASGPMYGFLNVFLAAAFLQAGLDPASARTLLEESSPAALLVDREGIEWRNRRLGVEQLRQTRKRLAISFGSCSFREPIDALRDLGLL